MSPPDSLRLVPDGEPAPRPPPPRAQRGRGVADNPSGRFERVRRVSDVEFPQDDPRAGPVEPAEGEDLPPLKTTLRDDAARSALSWNDSPDLGFEVSLNPYRGCEHGCAYCYARPYHEHLGLSAGLDFETVLFVKRNLPRLLEAELSAPRWTPRPIAISGVTDAYQPVERRLGLTRACLEVLARWRNPVGVVTKSALVTRDADVLSDLAQHGAARVWISLTTLDRALQLRLEPRASSPAQRLEAMAALTQAGVPVGVLTAPVIPGLSEHELPALLKAAAEAGARTAGMSVLRLPHGVKDLFSAWLREHRPHAAEKVLGRVRDLRGGALDDSRFGARMTGSGPRAERIRALFRAGCRRAGLSTEAPPLSTAAFQRPGPRQLGLFDDDAADDADGARGR